MTLFDILKVCLVSWKQKFSEQLCADIRGLVTNMDMEHGLALIPAWVSYHVPQSVWWNYLSIRILQREAS